MIKVVRTYILVKELHEQEMMQQQGWLMEEMQVIFKNCAPFTNYISEINNTQVDNVRNINVMMAMYLITKDSDNYSRTSGSLWE